MVKSLELGLKTINNNGPVLFTYFVRAAWQHSTMIPKKIHYCWLSGEPMPAKLRECLATWRQMMPEYEQVLWDKSRFDIDSIKFVQEACAMKKWAFAADYIRLYALYHEGGLYLDSDVFLNKSLNDLLGHRCVTAVEYHNEVVRKNGTLDMIDKNGVPLEPRERKPGIGLQAAIIASEPGHPFIKDCLDFYLDHSFVQEDGSLFDKMIAPDIFAIKAVDYGFRYVDERQELAEDLVILPSKLLAGGPDEADEDSFAVHLSYGSWRPKYSAKKVFEKISENKYAKRFLGKS